MSVYAKELPDNLEQAFQSLLVSVEPINEVVLVKDGPLTLELHAVISRYQDYLPMKIIELGNNVGLGLALNEGLKACTYDWVARFDSDDLIVPERFKKQLSFIKSNPGIDIVGGWVEEFDRDTLQTIVVRKVPENHEQIISYCQWRNPFNHPTVLYRRQSVLAVGGYQNDNLFEDYALWVRLILTGAKCANIPEILVRMRSGAEFIGRRGGIRYAVSEARIEWKFMRWGLINPIQLVINVTARMFLRILPRAFRGWIYRSALRR